MIATDAQVRILMRERKKGRTQEQAAGLNSSEQTTTKRNTQIVASHGKEIPAWHVYLIALFSAIPFIRFVVDVTRGFDHLIWARLGDDSFYYFEISKHIPYFNDSIPTSGFHPLYAYIISPLHKNLSYETAIIGSLVILVVSYCIGTWLVWALSLRYFSPLSALAASGAWAVSGYLYSITMTGVETILAVVFVLAAMSFFPDVPWQNKSTRPFILFSVLMALSFLARMDAPLILMPFAVLIGFSLIYQRRMGMLLVAGAIPILVLLIWLIYIFVQTGEVAPGSGAALRVIWGVSNSPLITDLGRIYGSLALLADNNTRLFFDLTELSLKYIIISYIALGILMLFIILKIFRQTQEYWLMTKAYIVLVVAGTCLWGSYYVFHHGGFRLWYFAYVALIAYCLIVPLFIIGIEFLTNKRKYIITIVFAVVLFVLMFSRPIIFAPQEYDKYKSATELNKFLEKLPAGSRIGAFNTGVYDYFSASDIINLDGVVNPQVRRAIEVGELSEYLALNNIHYLIEHDIGQAATLDLLVNDSRVELEKIIDLRDYYEPYQGKYSKDTFIWQLHFTDSEKESLSGESDN